MSPVYSAKLFDASPKCKDSPNTNSGSLSCLIYLCRDLLETYSLMPRVSKSGTFSMSLPLLTPMNATAEPLYTLLRTKKKESYSTGISNGAAVCMGDDLFIILEYL